MAEKRRQEGPYKVFFITSNQSSLDNKLEYSLTKSGMINLQIVLSKTQKYNRENFTTSVLTFDIKKDDLRNNDLDKDKKAYKAIIKLKQKGLLGDTKFDGIIFFKATKNNFIFDFKFNDYIGFTGTTLAPPHIKYPHSFQIKLYNEAFKKLKIKQNTYFAENLISDSQRLLIGQKFNIDLFLEIFKSCYSSSSVKTLLMCFNVGKATLPTYKIDPKEYSKILNLIEKNPKAIIRHCTEKDNPKKYYKSFFTLLLYFRLNYENEKIQELLSKIELWEYFKEILPANFTTFSNIEIPSELVNQMVNQTSLSFKIIQGTLFYLKLLEKILICINENIDKFHKVCSEEKKEIKMNDLTGPNKADNVENILKEIEKLVNYELEKGKFVVFDEEFFNNYTHYYFKKDLKKLLLVKKMIKFCQKVDKKLDPDYNGKIHETGLEMIKNGVLKNEELLDFIENEDIFFIKNQNDYLNLNYRPIAVFEGFDLENANEQFYEKWNEVNIFKKYSFSYNYYAEKAMIDKINHMKDFGKLLKLFNFENEKLCNKDTISLISNKYKKLIKTYTTETCPNFNKETSLLIYMLDKKTQTGKYFMENTIEKDFRSPEIINDIYLYLSANYTDISNKIVEHITNYFIKNLQNKNILKGENLLFLLKKLNSASIFRAILNKINNYAIKEEELFNEEKEIDSFKLLEGLQKEKLIEKYPGLNETEYILATINLEDTISKKLENGDIKYNIINSWYINPEKKKLLTERLLIIFFHSEKQVKTCIDSLKKYFIEIIKVKRFIKKLVDVLKLFYPKKHAQDIAFLEDFDSKIKDGMLNYLEEPESKNIISKYQELFPDLEKKNTLKESAFFRHFFNTKKDSNPLIKEDDIFNLTMNDFENLKKFFEPNWITTINEKILKECYKAIKGMDDDAIEKELKLLIKCFNLENIDNLFIAKLTDEINIFSKKEIIFQTINSCLYFIHELGATPTDFTKQLNQLKSDISKNISVDKIKQYGQSLEKYGINILKPKPEDLNYLSILSCLYNKKNSLQFIIKLTAEDCRHLQEVVSESENTFLTGAEINDMEKCSNFMNKILGDKNVKKTDIELISALIKEVPKEKNISVFFTQYTNNSGQIQELFSQKLDKSQATLKKIKNILNYSNFSLSIKNNEESYFQFTGSFDNEEKINQVIEYEEIIELRGRAMLTKKLGKDNSKEEQETFKLNKKFAERVNEIEKINGILKKIAEKGYCENTIIYIEIKNSEPKFASEAQKFNDYEECNKHLNKILTEITDTQINYYKNEKTQLLRYIYGRQFNLLNGVLSNISQKSLTPFLKYLTNDNVDKNLNLEMIKFNYDYDLGKGNKYICSLENINNFLIKFLSDNHITLEKIYKQNIIKDKYKNQFKGLYTYLLEDDKAGEVQKGVEEHILNWYQFLTDKTPMAQTVLLCNEETTSEEITAFMYRAILCQYHVVFMIGKIELLNPDKRQILTGLINTLFSGHENEMKSCLVFAYSDKTATIVQYLERIKGKQKLEHKDKTKDMEFTYEENVEIISSDKSGVGKSTHIKEQVKKEGKKYIHFPFGGEFSRKDVIKRLKDIDIEISLIKNVKPVIHLDLYDSKQIDLMKDFLYSFLITKLYGQNENLFYLSKDIEIKIEIPNGFVDFFLKFPILSMFKNKYVMSINKLPPLIVEKEINSNIQIVCNYLKLLKEKKIADKDLYIRNVSMKPEDIQSMLNEEFINESTKIDAIQLSPKECEELIKENIGIEFPTYYQIKCFVNALSGQLKKFSRIFQLTAAYLIQCGHKNMLNKPNLKNIRIKLLQGFIQNTQHFTKGSFNKLLNSQMDTFKVGVEQGNYDENKQDEVAIKALSDQQEIISFDKIKPSLIFFHEGEGQDFTIISTCKRDEPEYDDLLELRKTPILIQNQIYINYGKELEKVPKELINYSAFTHKMFFKEMKAILDLKNPIFTSEKNEDNKEYKSIEEIVGEYVFTADNFIKMVLILLRIRENIPVIMMGETGCGKTSLIRKLSELINNGESKMKILNIHAGITDQEIVEFLYKPEKEGKKSIIEEAKELGIKEAKKKEDYEKNEQIYYEKKLWIFLDEINTCNCMGLITEMMTKHSCQGKKLPNSIVFIGACNPYRMVVKDEEPNGLKIAGTKERKLVYTVNPLPHSLLNFIFNFGNLTPKDEQSYIKNMVVSPIESFYWKEVEKKNEKKDEQPPNDQEKKEGIINENEKLKKLEDYLNDEDLENYKKLKEMASQSIIEAQQYVRDKNDVSSVSLREIRRFSIFYNFFVEYLRKKRDLFGKIEQKDNFEIIDGFYKNLTDFQIYKYSINLSVYMCYYLRLTKKQFRQEFSLKMNSYFKEDFIKMPKREQEYIANNIEMKKGIAKNRALLENIFALFVCVNSKVPLFIVGKPGCSKSLSVQLLFKSMKGEISDNILFKTLPKLIINSYQGSLGSTSKGVLNIFKKARQILEKENNENLSKMISMIYFDEMGLAEHSPNNPLKVIHAELEYDLNEGEKKIAFVGISNWRLDASKMNRGLYLSIPQPDLEDLKQTAQTIAESYNRQLADEHKDLFETLAVTYHDYKLELNKTIKEDFHGSRDFYHLIKNAMRSLLKKAKEEQDTNIDEHVKERIGIDSLERNLGGLEFDNGISSLEIVKKIFKKKYENCPIDKKYDVLKAIKENINDKGSRYLLLISKSSVSNYLLSTILSDKTVNKDSSFYIGSRFLKDQRSEEYTLKILNKVQLQMEQNKVLLLTDLEPVYPALYDLFNQNFTVVSEKNYARIAIGSSNNTFSLVNDDFKCIVLVDQNVIDSEEPPFLNRFEKHVISFEYLLTVEMVKAADEIYKLIQDLVKSNLPDDDKFEMTYDLNKLLVNCDREEIQGIIYSKYRESQNKGKQLQIQNLQDFVLEKISLTLPMDIILFMKYSGFEQKYNNISEKIINFYNKGQHSNLYEFIKTMKNTKNVIYTFTNIEEPLLSKIPKEKIFKTEMFGEIHKENITDILISSLSSENELEAELEKFYLEPNKKIFVMKFNPEETDIMNYVKFFIENHIKEKNYDDENKNIKKAFIFSVHMNRIFEVDKQDPKKAKYVERNELGELISHLSDFYQIFIDNLNGENISLIDMMRCNENDLYKNCLKLDKEFMKNIYKAFSYFNYEFVMDIPFLKEEEYSVKIREYLEKDENLRNSIIDCVLRQKTKKIDVFSEILKNKHVKQEDIGLISVIQNYLSVLFADNLTQFVFKSEKDHFLSTLIFNKLYEEESNKEANNIGKEEIKKENDNNKIKPNDKEEENNKEANNIGKEDIKKENDNNKIKPNDKEEEEEEINLNDEIKKRNIGEKKIIDGKDKIGENKINDNFKEIEIINDKNNNEEGNEIKKINFNNNKLIQKLIAYYLENLNTNLTERFNKKIKNNKITLLLGLKLPGIRSILNSFRIYIKTELKDKYYNNEKDIRYIQEDEECMKEVNECKRNIKNNQKNMETEINKNELFQQLNEFGKKYPEDCKNFYELLLDDYYLIFLSDTLQNIKISYNNLQDYKNIIKKMINLRFSEEEKEMNDNIKSLSMKMVWLESNSEYISILLNMYQLLSLQVYDLFNKIEKIIDNKEVKYEVSKRSPHFTEEVNSSFFNIMESLLKIITSDFEIYENLDNQEFYAYITSLKTIVQNALRIVNDLIIYSKEVFTIQEFLNIQEHLNIVNKSNKDNILKVLHILSDQSKFTNNILKDETQYKDLSQNIQILHDFLFENLGDTDKFADLMLNICVDEIKKIKSEQYRAKLADIVLKNPKIIPKSYEFMSIILKGLIDTSPDLILDNLKDIKEANNTKLYLESINKTNNDALNEIILGIFENQFNSFFESIPKLSNEDLEQYFSKYYEFYTKQNKKNPTFIMFDTSLELFNNCLNYLEQSYLNAKEKEKNKVEDKDNDLICKLYCIAYIKMYLYKCIHFNHFNNQEFLYFENIDKAIKGNGDNDFRKMIKIYVFKIFFHILNNDYHEFTNYHYPNHGITFFEEFKEIFNQKKEAMLSYYFLPLEKEQIFDEEDKIFENYKFEEFNKSTKQFKELIEKNGIDIFYAITTNVIVSNLALKNYVLDTQEYSKYSSFIKSLFNDQLKIPDIVKKLFLLYSNDELYNSIMKPKLVLKDVVDINQKLFQILLYSLRFCLETADHDKPDEFLYSQFYSKNLSNILKEISIPGNNLLDNIIINNYYYIENHLKTKAQNHGVYVCSCGQFYEIPPCGFPWKPDDGKQAKCLNPACKKDVGYAERDPKNGGKHGMVIREGHFRIFKDEEHKKNEFAKYNDNDNNIPNRLLADYKKEKIDPILDGDKFGINKISKVRFLQNNMEIRKLSQVGYRLLNFILYSHLFFSNCLGIISDEEMKNYVSDEMTCLEMIEVDWDLLKDALISKGVQTIQVFMNMIFYKISEKIKNCKLIKTNEDRIKFEEEIEQILEESYKNYEEYSKKYIEKNKNALQLDKDNMKTLVNEMDDIDQYDNLPFYKFFLMTTYPTKDNFINELKKVPEFEIKYPLLNSYLIIENKEKELIKYLPEFNEFSNFMIDFYSYKISREEASKKIIKEEEIYKENKRGFQDMFKRFKKIWVHLKPYAVKFGCRDEMPPVDLNENTTLAHFLNDDGELLKGMYIASAYEKFITWQNTFLDQLIEPLRQNGILHHFVQNMGKCIDVQNAKKNETLNFDSINEAFNEILFDASHRNIFTQDKNINYLNYKQFIYDFDYIEKNLGEILLPGKVKFNGTETLRFVTYSFEGFRGNKTSVLSDFAGKYNPEPLSNDNKQKIYDTIKDKLQNQNDELSKILFSIQLLIYYLTQDIKEGKDKIKTIIGQLPDYVNLSKECLDFLNNQNDLKVNEITGAYSYIELLCFKPIIANLREHYKKKIDEKIIDDINKSFEEKKFQIITKVSLASACRILISRYLVSMREDTDYNENNKLDLYLNREEVWDQKLWEQNEKIEEDLEILRKNELILGQAYALYQALGGDEKEAYKGINIKDDDDKGEIKANPNEEEGNKKIIKRPKPKPRIKY